MAEKVKPVQTELQRILEQMDGYEDESQPVEVPPSVLATMHRLLRELAADIQILRDGDHCHEHACPFWRFGRRHGPCVCGAKELQDKVDAARAKWRLTEEPKSGGSS